ncbi:MAG: hypothetical protein JXA94_02180 [Parachlamydiales bacterium]|nr:hypothetical protein [Parachlamydiales bacterium]
MPIFLAILAILGFVLHLLFTKKEKSQKRTVELLLLYFLFFVGGIGSFIAFFAHVFFPDKTAALIGWQSGSPFQFEVGIANLALSVLAILSVFIRVKHFWMAIIIAYTVFLWGDAVGHIRQMIITGDFASGNAGIYFYQDVIFPLILIGLFIWLLKIEKTKN